MACLHIRGLSLPEIRAGDDLAALIVGALVASDPGGDSGGGPSDASGGSPSGGSEGGRGDASSGGSSGSSEGGRGGGSSGGVTSDGDERDAPFPGTLRGDQIVVVAHKVVSKAEGAVVALSDVEPSLRARELAAGPLAPGDGGERDPRAVQVVLDQSAEIVRAGHGVLICRTHHGFVCANAGVDASNALAADTLITLPRDPDASARALRARVRKLTGAAPGVLITDSFGRAWRHGQCDVALGCAGMQPLDDWRGRSDSTGHELRATWLAVADAAAAAADLARAKDSREPVVVIDGLKRFITAEDGPGAAALIRPLDEDLFR